MNLCVLDITLYGHRPAAQGDRHFLFFGTDGAIVISNPLLMAAFEAALVDSHKNMMDLLHIDCLVSRISYCNEKFRD